MNNGILKCFPELTFHISFFFIFPNTIFIINYSKSITSKVKLN